MPKCSQCSESAAFHELTNYAVKAEPNETTERLCFGCALKRLALLEVKVETDQKSLLQFTDERKAAVAELERVKAQCAAIQDQLEKLWSIPEMLDKAAYVFEDSKDGKECIEYLRTLYETDYEHVKSDYVLRAELDDLKRDAVFACFRCGSHDTPLYCRKCAKEAGL